MNVSNGWKHFACIENRGVICTNIDEIVGGLTVYAFILKISSKGLTVRHVCVPNKYSVVLTTAHAEVLCVGSVILKC